MSVIKIGEEEYECDRVEATLAEKLIYIQNEINVPKSKYNDFGGYPYRSAEDILNAAKPVLAKYGCVCYLTDDIVVRGDRFYVEATAHLKDLFHFGEEITVKAYAREVADKKSYDPAQLTGMASSYARKYALNGLYSLCDVKDADAAETGREMKMAEIMEDREIQRNKQRSQQQNQKTGGQRSNWKGKKDWKPDTNADEYEVKEPRWKPNATEIINKGKAIGLSEKDINNVIKKDFNKNGISSLTKDEFMAISGRLDKKKKENEAKQVEEIDIF